MKQENNMLLTIVLYIQRLDNTNTYLTLLGRYLNQDYHLFVYDNSPTPQHHKGEFDGSNIHYVSDVTNKGLSYAYNRAAEYALKSGCQWMMILDQDTSFNENIIDEFLLKQQLNPHIKLFVPPIKTDRNVNMSPAYSSWVKTYPISEDIRGEVCSKRYAPINSGMIINVEAFMNIGGYNEKVWLDYSDYQFMKRYRMYYDNFYILDSICIQEFSNEVQSKEQKINRYKIFCDCLKNCERLNYLDTLRYFTITLKWAASLFIETKDLIIIKIFISRYL